MRKIAIIGAGLAGTALAYVLKNKGFAPVIYEAGPDLASGASGNAIGLYNPRFTAEKGPQALFYEAAFFKALELFAQAGDAIDWNPCGALHLVTDEKKARRFPQTLANWGWGAGDMQMLSAARASEVAGVDVAYDALYLPRSGTISPRKLCAFYARDMNVYFNLNIQNLRDLEEDIIILACGMGCKTFAEAGFLSLKPVRGQITGIAQTKISQHLRCTIGYGGYITPALNGVHCLGSSFQPWLDHDTIIPEDDFDNIQKLKDFVPSLACEYTITEHRAAVRTTVKDHLPVIGRLVENIYVSTAHGSHGILSSLMGAHILADMIIAGAGDSFDGDMLSCLSPQKFF